MLSSLKSSANGSSSICFTFFDDVKLLIVSVPSFSKSTLSAFINSLALDFRCRTYNNPSKTKIKITIIHTTTIIIMFVLLFSGESFDATINKVLM